MSFRKVLSVLASVDLMLGEQPKGTAVATPRFQGSIMPRKDWKKRKKRIAMQEASRKANRK